MSTINTLLNADGSATHTFLNTKIIASVNGPLEVSRRDENPEAAALDVNVRTATGPGSPRDRRLESLLLSTFQHIVLIKQLPRTLIQITLQILETPETNTLPAWIASSTLLVLPALINAAQLALLAANIPLSFTVAPRLVLSSGEDSTVIGPDEKETLDHLCKKIGPTALHVFVFGVKGDQTQLATQASEGDFSADEWEEAYTLAENTVNREGHMETDEKADKRLGDGESLLQTLKAQ